MAFDPQDYYFKRAKTEDYAARSVYKLQEIHNRFRIFEIGDTVLDLGASPGSWSQYAAQLVGKNGRIVGVDLTPITLKIPNAHFIVADIREETTAQKILDTGLKIPVDVVISDMAPKTTGVKITDQSRSFELCTLALSCAQKWLKPGGNFVTKLFDGPDFNLFRDELRQSFRQVEILRPKSTRKESKELFFIGLHKLSQ